MPSKEDHKENMLQYLSDPANDMPTRVVLATDVLGMATSQQLYKMFTLEELEKIEAEALAIRRKKYAPELSKVDRAMLKAAAEGDARSAKLCYQRFEGWKEGKDINLAGDPDRPLKWQVEIIPAKTEKE